MNKTKNKDTGNYGEELAAEYLRTKGYRIIERNRQYPFGEIDILAETPWRIGRSSSIVLVEVKTVRGGGWGEAVDLVRFKKQRKLSLLSRALEQEYPNRDIRIDVIGIFGDRVDHIENAVS